MMSYCVKCDNSTDFVIEHRKETYMVKGEPIEIDAEVTICSVCGEAVWNEEVDELNIMKAYRIYRKKHNLLQPEEIQAIRAKYAVSQRVFSKILGVGEKTITRYENGCIQDVALNNLLYLMENPSNFENLFEKVKFQLQPEEIAAIETALSNYQPKIIYNACTRSKPQQYNGVLMYEVPKCYFGGNIKYA